MTLRQFAVLRARKTVAAINLDDLSLQDLKKLRKDVDRAIQTFEERKKAEAAAELEAIARERGFSLAELTNVVSSKARRPARPKFRHPDNPAVTWTGRGRKPRWFTDALAKGASEDDMRI